MHPTTIHQLAIQRQEQYRLEAESHRLAKLATQGASQDRGDAMASLRRAIDLLIHPLRTAGTSPA